MSEAETNISWLVLCAAVVARDWEPLPEGVLRVISHGGGKTAPGLSRINRCLRSGLLELMREAPDGTITVYSKADCEHLTVCAPLVHPAEGIRVEPYQEGDWFIRRAPDFAAPTSAVEPPPPAEPKGSAAGPSSPQVEPKPPRASKKRSRKKTPHGGPQSRRATAVLNRIFPEGYPDEDEMAWSDVWDMFCKGYSRYAEEHPSNIKCPSQSTVRRVMGRAE